LVGLRGTDPKKSSEVGSPSDPHAKSPHKKWILRNRLLYSCLLVFSFAVFFETECAIGSPSSTLPGGDREKLGIVQMKWWPESEHVRRTRKTSLSKRPQGNSLPNSGLGYWRTWGQIEKRGLMIVQMLRYGRFVSERWSLKLSKDEYGFTEMAGSKVVSLYSTRSWRAGLKPTEIRIFLSARMSMRTRETKRLTMFIYALWRLQTNNPRPMQEMVHVRGWN